MKRFTSILCSFLLLFTIALQSRSLVSADTNLVANSSMEQAAGTTPTSWSSDKWGTNKTTFTYNTTAGHTGTHSATVAMTGYTSGDAKWYFAPVTVSPSATYTYSDWYKSTVATDVDVVITTTAGKTNYLHQGTLAASADWKQASYTFKTSAAAAKVTVYHYIQSVGQLTTDDVTLNPGTVVTPPPAPTAPTVSITSPLNNATVSGTTTITSTATSSTGVANVQFKIDNTNLGAADTTSPYSASWDTTAVANGSHTISAVATGSNGLSATATATVTVNNVATPPPTAPAVTITAPANNATVSGTTTITSTATSSTGVANVQFKIDNTNLGAADTSSPYSASWNTTTVTNGSHTITAVATGTNGLSATATATVTVNNVVAAPPTVSITAPANNATVSGTTTITSTATSSTGVANVQFKVDNVNLGAADTTSPYSVSWNTSTVTNGSHTITAVATGTNGLSATATATVTVNNVVVTPPTVSVTAPAANSTVSGSTNLTANASDAGSIKSVQFKVDNANYGAADTTAPYSIAWDSTTVANGAHTVTAVATNNNNLTTTATTINFTVSNTVVTPPNPGNLIANPSVEQATGSTPTSWTSSSYGKNTTVFSYVTGGHTDGHSIKAVMTGYTGGAADWFFAPVSVTPGQNYAYSNWYISTVDTELDAMVTLADGTIQYDYVQIVPASSTWAKVSAQFVAPANAKTVSIYQVLAKNGTMQTDDYSFAAYQPAQFNRAIVSLNFDDGWRSIYTNGLPVLNKYGFVSTQYLNSTPVTDGYPDYMTYQMIKDFYNQGSELAWHTQNHTDLTTLTPAQMDTELTIPNQFLVGIGLPVTTFKNFASPYGAYNSSVITEVKKFYSTHRGVEDGYNSKDSFNPYDIKVQNIVATTTTADVQGWVNQAIANKTWLVIVYHEIGTNEDTTYNTPTADFDSQMNAIKQSGVTVETTQQALNEITPQL